MKQAHDFPVSTAVHTLLQQLEPGSTLSAVRPIEGDFANTAYVIEARSGDGSPIHLAVKRYVEFGGERADRARLEFRTLAWLQAHHIPAPPPLYLDEAGTLLGAPGIVTRYIHGEHIYAPADPLAWARELARMLAQIHATPCDTAAREFLLDANAEALWFLRSGAMPGFMSEHPDGPAVWQAVQELLPHCQPVESALVHIDYWPGNVLWRNGRITAVVDWEEAAYGDPSIDVAYCRMNLYLSGQAEAADEFLKAYEVASGQQIANLALWELAAVTRPMLDPAWEADVRPALQEFVVRARERT